MSHGINNTFLYSACKILSTFSNGTDSIQCRGTGFFIAKEKTPYLLTNRHVVDFDYAEGRATGYRLSKLLVDNRHFDPSTQIPSDILTFEIRNFNEFIFSQNDKNDIACLPRFDATLLPSKDGRTQEHTLAFSIPYDFLATENDFLTKLSVCDFIAFSGYPEPYDVRNDNPIFRMGSIASDPRTNYSCCAESIGDVVAYDGFSSGGASGSPVFVLQKGFPVEGAIIADANFYRKLLCVGINAGHIPERRKALEISGKTEEVSGMHSGISYFYKSTEIIKIIDSIHSGTTL